MRRSSIQKKIIEIPGLRINLKVASKEVESMEELIETIPYMRDIAAIYSLNSRRTLKNPRT